MDFYSKYMRMDVECKDIGGKSRGLGGCDVGQESVC